MISSLLFTISFAFSYFSNFSCFSFKESEKKVESFFSNYSEINQKKIICINPYGASKYRQIRMDKLEEIVSVILKKIDNVNLTFIFPPNKKLELEY